MRDINNQNQITMSMKVSNEMVSEKIGYDWRIKMMLCRVSPALHNLMNSSNDVNKSWANVVRLMFISEGKNLNNLNVSVNGYYNRVKSNLKDIDVIRYEGRELVRGSNWDRLYSDEDWSWFVMNTDSGAHAKIVK
jgi:hypothetical protein